MSLTRPKLEVNGINKVYEGGRVTPSLHALSDVSFSVDDKQFLVVLGPSGCGKSTLLKIIDGTESPTSGSVRLDGTEVAGRSGLGRAMVFQGADLFPWRTALQNVRFGLDVHGIPRAEADRVARAYLNLVGLSSFANSYPSQLSGGMRQRVGIARALAVDPELLLMDEPFGALDVQTRELMQEELLRIWDKERKTVVFVTHSIEEALFLADSIVVMSARPGRIDTMIDVPFQRPRRDEIRDDPAFRALRRDIWQRLKAGAKSAPDMIGAET